MTLDIVLAASLAAIIPGALDTRLTPRPRPAWRRPRATAAVEVGTHLLHYSLWLALVQRPLFALVITLALYALLIQSNNAKVRSLREPFTFTDFEYFSDALRHPRLYLPFFGIGLAIAATAATVLAIIVGFRWEASLFTTRSTAEGLGMIAMLALAGALALWQGLSRLPACRLEPARDLRRLGFVSYLWAYGLMMRQPLEAPTTRWPTLLADAAHAQDQRPNLVVVQSESFFDPRRWYPNIHPSVLRHFDELKREASLHGILDVPAWGANTVRTETGFLTGLTPAELGVHRFNPYRQLRHREVPNLAASLSALGYRTICIHPYPSRFYARHQVFPRLGFDEFIDIRDFDPMDREGQYIGDHAVASRVARRLETDTSRPLFLFVITMENHGPLHLEPAANASHHWYHARPGGKFNDLSVYLRHLRNADRMIGSLKRALGRTARPGMLCWYGDHVPILPDVYAQLGAPDGATDYVIWSTHRRPDDQPSIRPQRADQLGQTLLHHLLTRIDAVAATTSTPGTTRPAISTPQEGAS